MIRQAAAAEQTEEWLVSQAQGGDGEAFGQIIDRYRAGVINVVYRMCGDARLAEDAAQEAFLRAWQHLPAYRPQATLRSWLYRIAMNAALDMLRREKKPVDIETLALVSAEDKVEARFEQRERINLVRRAVLGLPEASRAVLILREYEGLSYAEIASALDIPAGTVMSRLSYARKSLQDKLYRYMEES